MPFIHPHNIIFSFFSPLKEAGENQIETPIRTHGESASTVTQRPGFQPHHVTRLFVLSGFPTSIGIAVTIRFLDHNRKQVGESRQLLSRVLN